jgi:hypothetical protein
VVDPTLHAGVEFGEGNRSLLALRSLPRFDSDEVDRRISQEWGLGASQQNGPDLIPFLAPSPSYLPAKPLTAGRLTIQPQFAENDRMIAAGGNGRAPP